MPDLQRRAQSRSVRIIQGYRAPDAYNIMNWRGAPGAASASRFLGDESRQVRLRA